MSAGPKPFDANAVPSPAPIAEEQAEQPAGPATTRPVAAEPAPEPADPIDTRQLGATLAAAMQDGGFHPVILFGTAASGKTSLLLSLFSTLIAEPRLEAGLVLCDPLLGARNTTGRQIHDQARHTFEVKTQAFLDRIKIPRTNIDLPFFIPVELRPADGKFAARFAFMESNGEFYRPERDSLRSPGGASFLYKDLQEEIEEFIATYEGAITFLYLAPYTQSEVYADPDVQADLEELKSASQAIQGVLASYDRIRAGDRSHDFHLMLVTKWDAHAARSADHTIGIAEDREALDRFVQQRYPQALAALQAIKVAPDQRALNAYCSGIIDERGLRPRSINDDVLADVQSYPIRLWTRLYGNALAAHGAVRVSPFPQPPQKHVLVRAFHRVLDLVSGHRP
ncbi:hypothetical protein [Sphingomonas sp.]|uniref:hypothetical protein n=1 Tax=Sphingomonas sp. TaxID=28214 RepID=UPI003CC6622F